MTFITASGHGHAAVKFLLLAVILLLILGLAQASSRAAPPEPQALLLGLRADRVADGNRLSRASLDPAGEVQSLRRLFSEAGVYHDPELGVPVALDHIYQLSLAPDTDLEAVMDRLRARPDVAFVEPDYVAEQIATPDDPLFAQQWGLTQIEAPSAWDVQTGGALVAVVDAGLDASHTDLADRLWTNPGEIAGNGLDDDNNGYVDDVHGWNFYGDNLDLDDSTGHGTQVAGLVGGTGNNGTGVAGVCWSCELMVLKVVQSGGNANYSDIATAITYAAAKGADVINLSLGGYSDSATLRAAVANAAGSAVLVGGAGNDGSQQPFYPAAYDEVLAVAGTDASDVRVDSSNYGTWVDLSAPGSNVMTTFSGGGYGEAAGTSLAAPFASGTAALLRAHHGWDPGLIRAHLAQTSTPIDSANPGFEGLLGMGRLDAGAALTVAATPAPFVEAITVDGEAGGKPEPGTTVDLILTLGNSWAPVSGLQGTLSSTDPYVTIVDARVDFGTLPTSGTAENSAPFRLTVAAGAPYGQTLDLQLVLRDGAGPVATLPLNLAVASQAVEVGGLIAADTVWNGDRIHRLTSNVVVMEGVTLTVEPGATVYASDGLTLRVDGHLQARGTAGSPIRFTAENASAPGAWGGIQTQDNGYAQLAFCEISYAETAIYGRIWNGHRQRSTVDHCTVHHNVTGVYEAVVTESQIVHNQAVGIIGGSVYGSEVAYNGKGIQGSNDIIRNLIHHGDYGIERGNTIISNTIVLNGVGLALDDAIYTPTVKSNNIDQNDRYNLLQLGRENAIHSQNWWGGTDLSTISTTIYDFVEDSSLGYIDVRPILTTPSPTAPPYLYNIAAVPDTTVGLQEMKLDLTFSGAMDGSQTPEVDLLLERLFARDDVPEWDNGQVSDVALTPDGNIWFATTENGVVRYDGNSWTVFYGTILPYYSVRELAVDTNGHLWATTQAGIARFDGSTWTKYGSFENPETPLPRLDADAVAADPEGGIWLPQCDFLTHFDGETVTAIPATDLATDAECLDAAKVTSDGTLWVGDRHQVYAYNGQQWQSYHPSPGGDVGLWEVGAMAPVGPDQVWITLENELYHYNGNAWSVHNPLGDSNGRYPSLTATADGEVWVTYADDFNQDQLLHYDGLNWTRVQLRPEQGTTVNLVDETADGSIWFGTELGAIQRFDTPVDVGQWSDDDTYQVQHQVTARMPRGPYQVAVSAAFAADGSSTPATTLPAFTVDYAGEVSDITPPPPPSLSVVGVDGDASAVEAAWQGGDADSAVTAYRYAIGTTAGGQEIVNWTVTQESRITRTGFGFSEGETYWFSVQAQNSGGLWSETSTRSFVAGQGLRTVFLPAVTAH